jgi:hypothetical protein
MYEFYGWASIRESVREVDEGNLDTIVEKIQAYIDQLAPRHTLVSYHTRLELFQGNSSVRCFTMSGQKNHKSAVIPDIFEIYELIAKLAPGSYGILYIRDDEDAHYWNDFQVYVLMRGKLTQRQDPFFSPIIPTIEDEVRGDEV